MILAKCWCATECSHNNSKDEQSMDLNYVFAHRNDEEEIFPLTVEEIAVAKKRKNLFKRKRSLSNTKVN